MGGKACVVCGFDSEDSADIEMRRILETGKTEPVCIYCAAKYDEACQEAAAIDKEQNG
jgi:hypothetical protein|tara:strand:+ start:3070 stop:3243 length:174 start_codon:yes stop_codon:yes gene_type:complete